MKSFDWITPHDLTDIGGMAATTVADAMISPSGEPAADGVVLKGGGIDMLDLMKEGLLTPRRLINLRGVAGLDGIVQRDDGGLRIGASVSLEALADDRSIRAQYRAVAEAAGCSASPQIRHVATIGGNLLQRPRCWYFRSRHHHCARKGGASCFAFAGENQYHAIFDHDGCAIVHPSTAATALVAFDAEVELVDADGARRALSLLDFFILPAVDVQRENVLKPGEVLAAILLPAPPPGRRSVHLKQAEKDSFDWPIADVAVVLDIDPTGRCQRASIVLGAAAPVPHRARAAEAAIVGQSIDDGTARIAGRAAMTGASALSRNAYKLPIFETLVRRAILAATGPV